MKKNRKNTGLQKDKVFMIAASVFVLTAFTMTGVYVADKNDPGDDGYLIDFSELEEQAKNENDTAKGSDGESEIVETKEANSGNVENPNKKASVEKYETQGLQDKYGLAKLEGTTQDTALANAAPVVEEAPVTYHFAENSTLAWPVVGNVLLNYSMDKAIYFKTMEQYRYNPSVVIAADTGEAITAAAAGRVKSVFHDAEIGDGVLFELGDGYELTYGQLKEIAVAEGDNIAQGDLIGYVADPTIYYSEEGSNLYIKLTKDGIPVNPLQILDAGNEAE